MKKNLKGCVEQLPVEEPQILWDVNRYDDIEAVGMKPDLAHKKNAHMTAAWQFAKTTRVRIPNPAALSQFRYLTFSVLSVGGAGGSFSLFFDCGDEARDGYECTLNIARDGWNDYRLELPFLRAVGTPSGWGDVRAIVLDSAVGGQANRSETVLYFDHLFGWEGTALPLYAKMPELKGAAVFSRTGTYSIVDRKKIANTPDGETAHPFERDGVLWLPMAPVAAGIARSAVVDNRAFTLNFTYRRKKYSFSATSCNMTVNGEEEPLGFYPAVVAGTLFFPAEFVKQFFHWRQIYLDPIGLIVISNRKNVFDPMRDEERVWQLVADTCFVRPTGEEILEDLHRNFPNPGRGRLFASFDELMQLRRDAKSDPALGGYVASLKEKWGSKSTAFVAPIPEKIPTDAEAVFHCDALLATAMLYRVTGDKIYSERTAELALATGAWEVWEQLSPARLGSLALALSVAYDWCRHVWSEGRKATVERTLLRGVLRPMLATLDGNGRMWRVGSPAAAVAGSGILAASLALADVYPQTSYKLLDRVLRNLEPCFAALSPDGGMVESAGAWADLSHSLALTVAMLRRACGTDYGLSAAPGFAATAYFPLYAETASGAWNYHNAAEDAIDTSMLFFFSRLSEDPVLARMRRRELLSGKKEVTPFDILFYVPVDDAFVPHLALDTVYRRAGLAVMRSDWGDGANLIGLHGGCNRASGGDLDAGSVILEMGGERFFAETGGDDSLPLLLRRRAAGQNAWFVDPHDESIPDQNPDAVARLTEMRTSDERAYAIVDMSGVSDRLARAKRGVMLTEARRVAVIQDEISMTDPAELTWRLWTRAEVQLTPSGRSATLTQNGKRLACRLGGVGSPARFEVEHFEKWTALTVRIPAREKVRIAVICRLLTEGESLGERGYEVVPMSRWCE